MSADVGRLTTELRVALPANSPLQVNVMELQRLIEQRTADVQRLQETLRRALSLLRGLPEETFGLTPTVGGGSQSRLLAEISELAQQGRVDNP